jgi:colicin import membrane protein
MMMELKESSVLFSLKELMTLEDQRIADEAARRRRSEEARASEAALLVHRQHDDDDARRRNEDARARAEAHREREEVARLEAIHHAEVLRARHAAEGAARIEELRVRQDHELQLAVIGRDKRAQRLARVAWAASALLLSVVVSGGVHGIREVNATTTRLARERQAVIEGKGANDRLEATLRAKEEQLTMLEKGVSDAPEHATPPAVPSEPQKPAPAPHPPTRPPPRPTAAQHGECTNQWDPLCTHLP